MSFLRRNGQNVWKKFVVNGIQVIYVWYAFLFNIKNTPPEVQLVLGRSQEAADYLSRSRTPPAQESPRGQQWFEPELKSLNIRTVESSPTTQRRETESPRRSSPSPSSSPPPVAEGIAVSPTLLKELSGGQKVEVIDFVKVCWQWILLVKLFSSTQTLKLPE